MEMADAELIAEFVVESQEGLANIEQQLLAIEAAGANVDVDAVNAVFRIMHSIKGASGFLGLDRIGALAHGLEEVLNRMRNREIVPSSELVTAILQSADFMKELIDAVDSSNDANIDSFISKLKQAGSDNPEPAPAPPPEPVAVVAPIASSTALTEAAREFVIESYENLDVMDRDLLALEQQPGNEGLLRNIFRTMHTLKGGAGFLGYASLEQLAHAAEGVLGKLRDGQVTLTDELLGLLLASVDKCREGLRLVEAGDKSSSFAIEAIIAQLQAATQGRPAPVRPAIPAAATPAAASSTEATKSVPAPRAAPEVKEKTLPASAPEGAGGDKGTPSVGDSTIRVDVALLDKLMTRVGELVLARNQILQRANTAIDAEFISAAQRLNLITTELQEGVMKTRMQPIGNVWSKFPRVVRDLSSQLGKQVRIEMEGKETELDKTIVEAIKDPLTHLVRNSIDHGIESPAARLAAGKPAEGLLHLSAFHEGGQVNIEITDDGAGLNLERIRKKGVERGLITADQASRMGDREVAQLILLPGFSTAEQVTSVSGRGVGMDVVKTNIERIGGALDLVNHPGAGMTVRIKIPLTLAIIPALVVTAGGIRYAIPQVSLQELVRLDEEETSRKIEYVYGAPVYRLRGKILPLVFLAEQLGLSEGAKSHENLQVANIVVLRANDKQFGLVVDRVCDTEEIVVKPLGRQLKHLNEYAGATIMGDGAVALILDVLGLASRAGLTGSAHGDSLKGSGDATTSACNDDKESLLIVDFGDSRRFGLPTSAVARLEKFASQKIEWANGHEVIQYRGEILPLVRLSNLFGAAGLERSSTSEARDIDTVVYSENGLACGFIVGKIIDIVATEVKSAARRSDNPHVLGTIVVQDRVTEIVNLPGIARSRVAAQPN